MKQELPSREKYWHEMDVEEKLIKLGGVVTTLWDRVKKLEFENMRMKKHQHVDNEILVPMHDSSQGVEVWGYNFHPLNMTDKREP